MKTVETMAAIVARLGAVTAITDALGSVPSAYQTHAIYTNAPQSDDSEDAAAFPYITVTGVNVAAYDTKTDTGAEQVIDVHIWYRGHTLAVPLGIADDVHSALHRHDLAVTGANVINCLFDGGNEMMDPDGITMHVVRSFRVTYFDL
jgi:hypothetical protein